VRGEEGMTLVELLIAMMVLTIGILALVAAYSSGYVALNRATRVSSATLVADAQMERFRALQYSAIQLNTSCGSTCTEDSTFTGDSAYSSAAQVTGCSSTTEPTCLPRHVHRVQLRERHVDHFAPELRIGKPVSRQACHARRAKLEPHQPGA
jgi:prepilin-type N-terminal cleavage/methylation domain-containing protein